MPAVMIHHTDTTQAGWDGPEQVKNLGADYTTTDLKRVFAWIPAGENPKKGDCSLPHHEVSADGTPGAANVEGCESAIGVLNGAMGGVDIPDEDRQAVYDHLAAHLKDADVEPAELKSAPAPVAVSAGEYVLSREMAADLGEPGNRLSDGFAVGGLLRSTGFLSADQIRASEGLTPMTDTTSADLSARAAQYTRTLGLERRNTPFRDVQMRAAADGTGGSKYQFTGYACITEAGYEMADWLGPFTEVVRNGAFTKTLQEDCDVAFLINHTGMTLARTKPGTLRLSEDDTGLYCEADLDPGNPHVAALYSAMQRGDIDEMSFAFWVMRQQWSPDWMQRDILEVSLHKGDVSAVNYGANPNTAGASMHARELQGHLAQLPAAQRREIYDRLAGEFGDQAPLLLADQASMRAWVAAQSKQLREGKALSAATLDVLTQVLDLVAQADEAVDAAQPLLADLMGVPNPDDDDSAEDPGDDDEDGPDAGDDDGGDEGDGGAQANAAGTSVSLYRARARAAALPR